MIRSYIIECLSTSGSPASGTNQTSFLINESFIATVRTFLAFCFGSILDVFLQSAFYTVFPSIDIFTVQLQRTYQFNNLFYWHSVTEYSGNQFGVVPIFFIELLRQSFNSRLISALVFKLEVVTLRSVFIYILMIRPLVTLLGNKIPSSSSCRPVKIS